MRDHFYDHIDNHMTLGRPEGRPEAELTDKIIYAEYISDLFNYGKKLESLGAEVKRFMDEKEKELRGKK